ncbi:hypothetical protein ACIGV8_25605 [Streptomyces albidoflavus]
MISLSAISLARWILKRDLIPTVSCVSDGRGMESCGPWEASWPMPPQDPIRWHELVNKCVGGSALQPVALSGKNLSEDEQLAVACCLHQVRCRLGAGADQLRGADQVVLGGWITVCKGRRQVVSFTEHVGSCQAQNR